MRVVLYGVGVRMRELMRQGAFSELDIVGIVGGNPGGLEGYKVWRKEELMQSELYDAIIVTLGNINACKDARNFFCEKKIDPAKIVFLYNDVYQERNIIEASVSNKELLEAMPAKIRSLINKERVKERLFRPSVCSLDYFDSEDIIGQSFANEDEQYFQDYFRFRTFELLSKEIKRNSIKGSIAELGVYQGTFAALMNEIFNNRLLYLYDTFSSFEQGEYEQEKKNGNVLSGFIDKFRDTSEKMVMNKMKFPGNCILRKGLFPDSLMAEDYSEKFAFVSLDVDLEESTYQGLKFFYPRVVEGGYIMIHDYNDGMLHECIHNAVVRYEKDEGKIKKVPIADASGTLIIAK